VLVGVGVGDGFGGMYGYLLVIISSIADKLCPVIS